MTTTTQATGFSDHWYTEAFRTADPMTLPDGSTIRVIRAPLFLASKLNAWHDRGNGDFLAQDLEDILSIIDGRPVLLDEVAQSSPEVKRFLSEEFSKLLAAETFIEAVPGHLGGGDIARQRSELALTVMRQIVAIGLP